MKSSVIALGTLGLLLSLASTPASAADAGKKYCLNPASGGSSCGYSSLEQCQETMRGRNGWCTEQVDFSKWGPSYGQPENSFAYDPPGGKLNKRRMSQDEKDIQGIYKKDMPSKGVGAE